MSIQLSYQGEKRTRTENGTQRTLTYTGTKSEVESYLSGLDIGSTNSSGETISSAAVSQQEGDIWKCEVNYVIQNADGSLVPNTQYGKKSASLNCGLLSLPIEGHPNYLMNWNNYLIAKASGTTIPTTPSWWDTDEYGSVHNATITKQFKWVKDVDNLEDGWIVIEVPQKPGVSTYDMATYQITESVKCKSADAAGRYAANHINAICEPDNRLGISGGNWKCDGATVSYNGKAWIATMTYTRSGDDEGWDEDIYG